MNKYLVYKISGGLLHMYYSINNAIHLSILSKRHLIIDTYSGAFCNDFNKYFTINGFNDYSTNYDVLYNDNLIKNHEFEPYIDAYVEWNQMSNMFLIDKLVNRTFDDIINSNEKIIYYAWTYPFDESERPYYIRVRSDIVKVLGKYKINFDYIGVHYRNTDINHNINEFISKIIKLLNKTKTIYLSTDDYNAYDNFKKLLPKNINIIQYTKPYKSNGEGIHLINPDKDEVIMNTLIDLYCLKDATYFIPSIKSGFSNKILEIRKNDTFFY